MELRPTTKMENNTATTKTTSRGTEQGKIPEKSQEGGTCQDGGSTGRNHGLLEG